MKSTLTSHDRHIADCMRFTCILLMDTCNQSGTKPNLVAKIWPPALVTICVWLPKLVANVSSQFHHLVNTGLAVGSLIKWLPIMVVHTCKLDTIWVVYISLIGWLHPIVIAFNTLPSAVLRLLVCGTSLNSLGLVHWKINLSLPWKLIFSKKLPQLVALQIFQSSHLSHGKSLNQGVSSHYH